MNDEEFTKWLESTLVGVSPEELVKEFEALGCEFEETTPDAIFLSKVRLQANHFLKVAGNLHVWCVAEMTCKGSDELTFTPAMWVPLEADICGRDLAGNLSVKLTTKDVVTMNAREKWNALDHPDLALVS